MVVEFLKDRFEEIENPMEFYRSIFPVNSFEKKGIQDTDSHIYNGIMNLVVTDSKTGKFQNAFRYVVTDDLEIISKVIDKNTKNMRDETSTKRFMTLMNGISYIGDRRKSVNAREMYAMIIEVDSLLGEDERKVSVDGQVWYDAISEIPESGTLQIKDISDHRGIKQILHLIENGYLPRPTYIVSSGSPGGIHLYYVFDEPIPLYPDTVKYLQEYRKILIEHLWLDNVTSLYNNIQYESLFQSFRMVGSQNKRNWAVRAFRYGDKTNMDEMIDFPCFEQFNLDHKKKKSKVTISLEEAKRRYPEWYQRRVVDKEDKGTWTCKRDLYEWWKRQVRLKYTVGHRYYALMCMSIYAVKCDISADELEKDMWDIYNAMKETEDSETAKNNPLTPHDVDCALQNHRDKNIDPHTFTIDFISDRTGIAIQRNKRNGLKRHQHLKMCRFKEFDISPNAEENKRKWEEHKGHIFTTKEKSKGGQATKEHIVKRWQVMNPEGTKAECKKDTGLSWDTIRKWWREAKL